MNSTQIETYEVSRSIKMPHDAMAMLLLLRALSDQMNRFSACSTGIFADAAAYGIYTEVRREVDRLCIAAQDQLTDKYGFEPGAQYNVQKPPPGESYYTMTPV